MGEKQESKVCFDKIKSKHVEGLGGSNAFQEVVRDFPQNTSVRLTKDQVVAFWSIVAGFMKQAGYQLLGSSLDETDVIGAISCGNYQALTDSQLESLSNSAQNLIKLIKAQKSH